MRGSRARNSSPGIGTTSPAPPLVAGDLAPSSVGARRASSDPDIATARNTFFWPSDRRHCTAHTSSSGDAVAAGLQLRAEYSLRPCAGAARVPSPSVDSRISHAQPASRDILRLTVTTTNLHFYFPRNIYPVIIKFAIYRLEIQK